ncbi:MULTISPECIES: DMT family transporter [Alphaproteobacteria]|uniref:Permease n=2 Tax=Alphaproteobacteria TaxID=28211 RepID=A0A512HEL9_9HYPH|nr:MULTISPECIES: DMT family transporter [Alphaproteobacteria]GEO83905.1 permease [Ciceribacter naphthalenivorans]GLR21217.1 permease [Ciceribacter naphthalenivorans]GLT04073.1 permease [Sphingomonas psychrolutea]
MSRIQANLVLLLAAAIWGGGFVAQSEAMEWLGPNWFNALRFALATIAVLPFALREGTRAGRPLALRDYGWFLLVGLSLLFAQTLQQIGIQSTSVTNASFLTGLYVILVPLIAVLFLRRRPHWIIWPTALVTVIGILLLNGGSLSALGDGDLLIILCAAFLAVQITLTPIAVGISGRPLALAAVQFAVCAFGAGLGAVTLEPISTSAVMSALPEILYGGILSSGLAFVLQIIGQRYTTAPQAAIFLSSEALFGALFGALLLAETLPVIGYVGCALIFAAMLLVELVPELTRRRAAPA